MMMAQQEINLLLLDKLARGASDGPWQCSRGGNVFAGNDLVAEFPPCQGHRGKRNAKFAAAMNPDVARQLIRRTLEAESMIERLRSAHEGATCPEETLDNMMKILKEDRASEKTMESLKTHWQADAVSSLRFPTMLRKMWSGGEVQQWLEEQADEMRRHAEGGNQ
jgi:hypothetical protein